jgi:hypothetical protein
MNAANIAVNAEKAKHLVEKAVESANANVNVNAATDTVQAAAASANSWANIDWSHPNWDLFVILFFIGGALLYGMSLGRDRIIVILVSIYMALTVVTFLPPIELAVNNFAVQIGAFIGVFVGLFFLLSRSALLRTFGRSTSQGSWLQVMLFSILHVGLLLSVTLSYLPADVANNFSPLIRNTFTGQWQEFGWICAPIVAMVLLKSSSGAGRPREEF